MNRISRELVRGLRELERNLSIPVFTFASRDYACCPNIASASKLLGLGGFGLTSDLQLFSRLVALQPGTGPTEDQIITYASKRYRIKVRSELAGGDVIAFQCESADTGA